MGKRGAPLSTVSKESVSVCGGSGSTADPFLNPDQCEAAAQQLSKIIVSCEDSSNSTSSEKEVMRLDKNSKLTQVKVTAEIMQLGRELSKDHRVQSAVLEHFKFKSPTQEDVMNYLRETVDQLREDLEEQRQLNQSLILFQDRLQGQMGKLKKQNSRIKRKLARLESDASNQNTMQPLTGIIVEAHTEDFEIPTGLAIALASPRDCAASVPHAVAEAARIVAAQPVRATEQPAPEPTTSQIDATETTLNLDERNLIADETTRESLISRATQLGLCVSIGVAAVIIAIGFLQRR